MSRLASTEEILEACKMRLAGSSTAQIGHALERSDAWVRRWTDGFDPPQTPKPVVKRIVRVLKKTRDPLWLPQEPTLSLRVRNMARRGFDVPPSKQADFDNLKTKGYTVAMIRKILSLE